MWVVVIEWSGNSAPSTFYRRLKKVTGASARGNRTGYGGAIVQESVVVVPSQTLAQIVVSLVEETACRCGFEDVEVRWAPVDLDLPEVPEEVRAQWFDIDTQLSQRGRPPAHKERWVTVCFECARVGAVEIRADHTPYQCPHCGGARIRQRTGELELVTVSSGAGLWIKWLVSRFQRGWFEPAFVEERPGRVALAIPAVEDADEAVAVDRIGASQIPELLKSIGDDRVALRLLDGLLCSLAHIPESQRRDARLRAMIQFYSRNPYHRSGITLPVVPEGDFDILDAAAVVQEDLLPWVPVLFNPRADDAGQGRQGARSFGAEPVKSVEIPHFAAVGK